MGDLRYAWLSERDAETTATGTLPTIVTGEAGALCRGGGDDDAFDLGAAVVHEDIFGDRLSDARFPCVEDERGSDPSWLYFDDVDDFVRRTWVLPVEHIATGVPIDVVFGESGLEDQFISRARRIDLGGVTVPVPSP